MEFSGGGIRNGILNLVLKDLNELQAAYMPFVKNGGLFIPSRRSYRLGEEVFFLLELMDEPEKIPLSGKVVWVTPKGVASNRWPGIGVQFDEHQGPLVDKIDTYLADTANSQAVTHTM